MSNSTYCGHAPGHVRSAFEEAVEQMNKWRLAEPEPKINFEIDYEPRPITLAEACTLVSRCSDIMPGWMVDILEEHGLKSRTYAAGARALRSWLSTQRRLRFAVVN